jgi:hypothetical protein
MDRRDFLQGIAATAAGLQVLSSSVSAAVDPGTPATKERARRVIPSAAISVEGYTLVAEFEADSLAWKVYEDLRTREGALVFLSSAGESRVLAKSAEASMPEGTPYLGLALKDIGLASADLLADRLLQNGDPAPEVV